MFDFPKAVAIKEEGPREGFQIEKGLISTDDKVRLIDALSETYAGLAKGQPGAARSGTGETSAESAAAGGERDPALCRCRGAG